MHLREILRLTMIKRRRLKVQLLPCLVALGQRKELCHLLTCLANNGPTGWHRVKYRLDWTIFLDYFLDYFLDDFLDDFSDDFLDDFIRGEAHL